MLPRTRTRITARAARTAMVLAAVAASFLAPAGAVAAGGATLSLKDVPRTVVVHPADEGAEASTSDFEVPVAVVPGDEEPARNVTVVVDASGLEGIARVTGGGYGNCTGSGWVFTCAYGTLHHDGESNAPFEILGLDGVEPGDSGTVTYTASADNAAPVTGTTRMVVGGPTLDAPGEELKVDGVEPGRPAPLTPAFANRTRFTAERGVALRVTAEGGLTLKARHSNCSYAGTPPTSAWCVFPTKAAPGAAYRTGSPLSYVAAERQLSGTLVYHWSSAPEKPAGHTVRGRGAPLTLVRTADGDFGGADGTVAVETTVQADYRPVTGTVRGRVGDTVSVRLGVRDLGPGRLLGDEVKGRFEVVPPEGTTVTSVPYTFEDTDSAWGCARPERPGGAFLCELGATAFLAPQGADGTRAIDFRIRIDRQVPGARGTVRTFNPYDRTPGNDTAVIPVDASPAPPRQAASLTAWAAGAAGAAAAVALAVVHRRRRRRGPAAS
ncbi:hypothetical protein ACFY8O_31575 [Streptomyces argenteolus]|uniref:Neocarzinostatin family protein n=1 Tax=Streptomyces argenteolus TaxID=67274 RepID=A0ABW6XFD1_9ACTN